MRRDYSALTLEITKAQNRNSILLVSVLEFRASVASLGGPGQPVIAQSRAPSQSAVKVIPTSPMAAASRNSEWSATSQQAALTVCRLPLAFDMTLEPNHRNGLRGVLRPTTTEAVLPP